MSDEHSWEPTLPSVSGDDEKKEPVPKRFESDDETEESTIPDDPVEKEEYMKRREFILRIERMPARKHVGELAGAIYDLDRRMDGFEKRMDGFEKRMGRMEGMLTMILDEIRVSGCANQIPMAQVVADFCDRVKGQVDSWNYGACLCEYPVLNLMGHSGGMTWFCNIGLLLIVIIGFTTTSWLCRTTRGHSPSYPTVIVLVLFDDLSSLRSQDSNLSSSLQL